MKPLEPVRKRPRLYRSDTIFIPHPYQPQPVPKYRFEDAVEKIPEEYARGSPELTQLNHETIARYFCQRVEDTDSITVIPDLKERLSKIEASLLKLLVNVGNNQRETYHEYCVLYDESEVLFNVRTHPECEDPLENRLHNIQYLHLNLIQRLESFGEVTFVNHGTVWDWETQDWYEAEPYTYGEILHPIGETTEEH